MACGKEVSSYVEQEQICGMCKLCPVTRLWAPFFVWWIRNFVSTTLPLLPRKEGLHPKTIAEEQLTPGSMVMKPPPPLLWRTASTLTMATTGVLSRLFLYGTQRVEVDGMDTFLALLKSRRGKRNAGLLTG